MRRAARAIVIKDNQLLVMARNKFGNKYVTLPGGGVEPGESLEHAIMRELQEEASIAAVNPVLRYIEHAGDPYGDQYVFSLTYKSGTPKLAADAPEELINKLGRNLYEPFWLPLGELEKTSVMSPELKKHLLIDLPDNLPGEVVEFTWQ